MMPVPHRTVHRISDLLDVTSPLPADRDHIRVSSPSSHTDPGVRFTRPTFVDRAGISVPVVSGRPTYVWPSGMSSLRPVAFQVPSGRPACHPQAFLPVVGPHRAPLRLSIHQSNDSSPR